jgi:catechol 2,3-dioxygenase-like lactoylglutathione lyase family enzyme
MLIKLGSRRARVNYHLAMRQEVDRLVRLYENKRISRRELIGALLAAAAVPGADAAAQQAAPAPTANLTGTPPPATALFRGRTLNHVTLMVRDLEQSRRFYQELVGATVLLDGRRAAATTAPPASAPAAGGGWFDLRFGDSFVSVLRAGSSPTIHHFAIGLDPWPGADRTAEMVRQRFPQSDPRVDRNPLSKAAEVQSVMLKDPDGINVQLGSVAYQL